MKSTTNNYNNSTPNENKVDGIEWPQILAILVVSLAPLTTGIFFAWTSPFIVKITEDKENYDISEDEAYYFTFLPAASMLLTCFPFSKLNDLLGRKRTLLLISIPHILAWILISLAESVYVFYAARICAGIADASVFSSLPMYIGEIATPKIRGSWGNSMTFAIYFGQLFITVIGNFFGVKETAYICVTFPILFALLVTFMPESPYFYIMKGRVEDSKKSLRWLRGKEDVEEDFLSLKADVERQISERGTWKDVFTIDSNRKAFTAGCFLRISQQLGGVFAFSSYTQYIFEKAGGSISAAVSTIICASLSVVLIFCAAFTVDIFGRKKSYMGSLATCSFPLLLEGIYFLIEQFFPELDLSSVNWIPFAGMLLYVVFSSFGVAIIPTLMLGELFSASIKAKGLTLLLIVFAFSQALSSSLFYILGTNVGFYCPFLVFAGCSLIATILSIYLVPETKGKTLEEIQQSLKMKNKGKV